MFSDKRSDASARTIDGACNAAAQRAPEIGRQVERNRNIANVLHEVAAALEQRLTPVLRCTPESSTKDVREKEIVLTSLGEALNEVASENEKTAEFLGSILRRIEL